MKEGESLEKMQAEGLPEKFKALGSGFIDTKRWILTIHDSLGSGMPAASGKPRRG